MAIIELSSIVGIESFQVSTQSNNVFIDLQNGNARPIFKASSSRFIRVNLVALTDEVRSYLRGVVGAASYSTDQLKIVIPAESSNYLGDLTADIELGADAVQGSNTIYIVNSSDADTFPSVDDVYVGMQFNIGDSSKLYTVNSYRASDGRAIIYPYLSTDFSSGTNIVYDSIYVIGNIVSNIDEDILPFNFNFLRYPIIVREYV